MPALSMIPSHSIGMARGRAGRRPAPPRRRPSLPPGRARTRSARDDGRTRCRRCRRAAAPPLLSAASAASRSTRCESVVEPFDTEHDDGERLDRDDARSRPRARACPARRAEGVCRAPAVRDRLRRRGLPGSVPASTRRPVAPASGPLSTRASSASTGSSAAIRRARLRSSSGSASASLRLLAEARRQDGAPRTRLVSGSRIASSRSPRRQEMSLCA